MSEESDPLSPTILYDVYTISSTPGAPLIWPCVPALGALDGGSGCYMSLLRKPTVALSNYKIAHVALSNLYEMPMSHVTIFLNLVSHVTKA